MKSNKEHDEKLPSYGGQALIEGILMRGRNYVVAGFRDPDGSIQIEEEELTGIYKSKLSKIPFFRGLIILWDSLSLGMKYLTLSANIQSGEDEKIEGPALYLTLLISVGFSIGLFFVLPSLIVGTLSKFIKVSPFAINFGEGIMRLLILLFYLWIIGKSSDIARVFAYHGAEHKTINAYEHNIEIIIENVRPFPLAHARCGTSFLLTLVLLSIIIFTLLGPMPMLQRIISRILLVPIISMFSYEAIRWMGNHSDNLLVRSLSYPNLLLQKLTTREPDDEMIEIAITAFN
ncbi:MAG: DUF1385 domain-containing protein, partial [Pelolinea sp.]|nr:DUF1385 domain-containing protein [Pelolinea sp.]